MRVQQGRASALTKRYLPHFNMPDTPLLLWAQCGSGLVARTCKEDEGARLRGRQPRALRAAVLCGLAYQCPAQARAPSGRGRDLNARDAASADDAALCSAAGSKAVLKSRSNTVTKDELFSLEDSLPQASFVAALNGRYVSVKQGKAETIVRIRCPFDVRTPPRNNVRSPPELKVTASLRLVS